MMLLRLYQLRYQEVCLESKPTKILLLRVYRARMGMKKLGKGVRKMMIK